MEEEQKTSTQIEEAFAMEFEAEMAEEVHEIDHDQELLQLQKRKSTPKVVIEEFVTDLDDEDAEMDCPNAEAEGKKPHKIKTHYEIDDVSIPTV